MWQLTITRNSNGYSLKGEEIDAVIQDGLDTLESHEELLWTVMDYFGFSGSKHDKERLRIVRKKGEKYAQK